MSIETALYSREALTVKENYPHLDRSSQLLPCSLPYHGLAGEYDRYAIINNSIQCIHGYP